MARDRTGHKVPGTQPERGISITASDLTGIGEPAGEAAVPTNDHHLDPIFHPRAVAVVGVSSRPGPEGFEGGLFLNALMMQGYDREHPLYPVNPKMTEVRGLRCYPSVLECPDPVDHVISQIPSAGIPELVDQCIKKGVRSLHFFTAGLSETGDPELVALERQLVEKSRAAGLRLIGPNCMGVYVPGVGLSFHPGAPHEPGDVFMLSQSGANAGTILSDLGGRGMRFSKGVSYGNSADLKAFDFLDYAAHDPQTKLVVGYIEGVRDGRAFFSALKRVAREKPTILLKGGITADGARAANSHTGSLAGSVDVFEALCRQTGAIRAEKMDDLQDIAVAVRTRIGGVSGRNVTLVGAGGGIAVLSSDAMAAEGLRVPPLPEETQQELREFIPIAGTSVRNPVDATFGRDHPLDFLEDYDRTRRAFEAIARAPSTDMIFTTIGTRGNPLSERTEQAREKRLKLTIEEFAGIQERLGVPIAMIRREGRDAELLQYAHRLGVAVFPTIERASRAVARVMDWRDRRAGLPELF